MSIKSLMDIVLYLPYVKCGSISFLYFSEKDNYVVFNLSENIFSFNPTQLQDPDLYASIAGTAAPALLVLFFSTSTAGWFLIPIVFLSCGFSLSAGIILLLKNGNDILESGLIAEIPAIAATAALLFLGELSLQRALYLKRLFGSTSGCGEDHKSAAGLIAAGLLIAASVWIRSRICFLIK